MQQVSQQSSGMRLDVKAAAGRQPASVPPSHSSGDGRGRGAPVAASPAPMRAWAQKGGWLTLRVYR